MSATKLVIYHGGSWVGNCYEGGMIKWVNVHRDLSCDALVKLVQDVAKVDAARYNLQLCSLAFTNSGIAHSRFENDNNVSYIMANKSNVNSSVPLETPEVNPSMGLDTLAVNSVLVGQVLVIVPTVATTTPAINSFVRNMHDLVMN
ncbi:hypothetical protein Ddye_019485 [Dipteronia dyeriana]|uniref:Uncharacterized protein n=1 Tax=Dipteronia dyeriana TaxID=168575 RepID=A0AAD9TYW4_9ROSI|nr:hypothetical protein Ddye_019485 [Dipteronia dyeriana]